jgi:lipopolysaccharide transport system permease protein
MFLGGHLSSIVLEELKSLRTHWQMWFLLGSQDIKLRYRRSTIGPFWLTISTAVTIYSMGFLYSYLFRVNVHDYFPYLASGIISWTFIATLLQESSSVLVESVTYIKNQSCYMSIFVMRLILRNCIVFSHNILVFIPIMLFFKLELNWHYFLMIPGLIILCINAFAWGGVIAIAGTRYRDFEQIVKSLIQIVFFVTPVMWLPSLLPEKYHWIIDYNPFAQYLTIIRNPMLGQTISLHALISVGTLSLLGLGLFAVCMHKYKHRIVFWL